jgi:arylsulfatase I/J
MFAGTCAGNNYPLRGGKFSNFEGGIRTNAFVSGGAIPESRRGSKETALVTGWDFYATHLAAAGISSIVDEAAQMAGLPDLDSINQWPLFTGANVTSPRVEMSIGDTTAMTYNGKGDTLVGGLLRADGLKLLLGAENKLFLIDQDVIAGGPLYPNASSWDLFPQAHVKFCGRTAATGCLFNVTEDPSEEKNIASERKEDFDAMLARIDSLQRSVFSPDRGEDDGRACAMGTGAYGGYWGPFTGF